MHITNLHHCWVNTITNIKTRVQIHYFHISDTKRDTGKHKGKILIMGLQIKTKSFLSTAKLSTDLPRWPQGKYTCLTYIHKQQNDNSKEMQVFQGLGKGYGIMQ